MIEIGIAFAAGVLSSETVRRLWTKYVTPKIAALKLKIAADFAKL